MKKILLSLSAVAILFASCENAPKADNAETTEAKEAAEAIGATYNVDLANSQVDFIGTKPVGKHNGMINLKEGIIMVENNAVTGGKFVIDMNTLKALDQDSLGNAKLGGHLMSPDFFDVANFPTATFEITGVTEGVDTTNKELINKEATHMVTGNLTLKDVTKSISFPAKIAIDGNTVTSDAQFNIDRTNWNLNYGNDQSLGDKFISPTVNIGLKIVANK